MKRETALVRVPPREVNEHLALIVCTERISRRERDLNRHALCADLIRQGPNRSRGQRIWLKA